MGRKSRMSKQVKVDRRIEPEDLDDEDDDQYENDGFLVDDLEEDEAGEDSDDAKQKKRKKKRESKKTYVLDEDDYELLQENIPGYHRPKLESENFKRLKKARVDGDEGPSAVFGKEEYDRSGMAKEKLTRTLFGDDDGDSSEDLLDEGKDALLSEDEIADFIVEEVEKTEPAAPSRSVKANKKKSKKSAGHSSRQSVNDIFGGLDDIYKLGPENVSKYSEPNESKEKKVEDEFEPILVPEKYMIKKDEHIRETDIPERMQISEETTGSLPPHDMSIDRESIWILNQFKMGMVPWFHKGGNTSTTTEEGNELPILKDDVKRFLELVHVQKLDVPFIAMYRKEECPSLFKDIQVADEENQDFSDDKPTLRWHKVVWAIMDLDRKWLLFQKRKGALQMYYNKRFDEDRNIYDETRLHLDQKFFESIIKSLNVAETEREIDDVDSKFNLHFPPGDVVDEGEFKRPRRKSQYGICSEAGLREVACKIGYSSEEFGLLISLEQMRMDELEDVEETPDDMASKFTCQTFENPQAVLRGARHMAALEISCEPFVRKHVRGVFMENVTISTSPTVEGKATIDSHHQFAGIKWLKEKPLTKFDDAQWLLIQKAEEDNLIQVSIKLPASSHDKLISDAQEYYVSGGVSKYAQLWNEQRKQIINDAFDGFLLPSMEKEARSLLRSRAKSWLLMEYGRILWKKVSVGPYQKKGQDGNLSKVPARVMACCWGPGRPATTFVMLDSFGEIVDVLSAGSLSIRGQNVNDQQRKKNDQQRIVKFMMDHKPDVVVLGAVNVPCSRLKEDITEIIQKALEDSSEDGLSVVYGDESLPRLYENSKTEIYPLPRLQGFVSQILELLAVIFKLRFWRCRSEFKPFLFNFTMFWRMTGLSTTSPVETILDKENFTLEELLDEDEIIQECKALNNRLINFLRERTQVEQLVRYIVEEAPEDAEKGRTFKFPFIACEIFTCEVDIILKALVEDEELMNLLFSFLEPEHPHSALLAGYFSKVVVCLLLRKTVPLMNYIQAHQEIIKKLVDLIGITSIMEVLIRLIGADEHLYTSYVDSMQWLEDTDVLEMIVDKLSSTDCPEVHANAAEALCAITRYAPPGLAAKISSPSFIARLFRHALEDSRPNSVLVHSLSVCISLLDPKRQTSGTYYMYNRQSTHGPAASAKPETVEGMLESLGNLLKLLNVSAEVNVLLTTYGKLQPPLGKHRLKIIEFISVLMTVSSEAAEKELIRLGALRRILELFFEYPYNNFIHHHIEQIIDSCLESKNSSLIKHVLEDCLLVRKILDAEKNCALDSDPKNPTVPAEGRTAPRIGNVGHMTRIANKLIEKGTNNSFIESYLQGDSEWVEWHTDVLLKRNTLENVYQWACGRPTTLHDRGRDSDDDDYQDRDYDVAALANNLSQAFRYGIYENDDNDEGHGSLERDDEDVYFDDESAEVVISSLRLGDDQESGSLFTNSNWFAFEEERAEQEQSTSAVASSPSPTTEAAAGGGSGGGDDDVTSDKNDKDVVDAATSEVPESKPGPDDTVIGKSTEDLKPSESDKPPEWIEWRESVEPSGEPPIEPTTVESAETSVSLPNGNLDDDIVPKEEEKVSLPSAATGKPDANDGKTDAGGGGPE